MKVFIFDKFPTVDFQDSITLDFGKDDEKMNEIIKIALEKEKTVMIYNNEVTADDEE